MFKIQWKEQEELGGEEIKHGAMAEVRWGERLDTERLKQKKWGDRLPQKQHLRTPLDPASVSRQKSQV